ncbi:hypothetical protein KIM372_08450 [Bombiscardovia nodaiensis]|uniref:SCP domain-containing protein n=1 Tax=Bombiscardovia nodaiensis TaxID=2932181 RepID=A0ABM8B813_9BIFI|nr:hypothetical protein KIM372_08450 [Bombiscardovia nodaiensis]
MEHRKTNTSAKHAEDKGWSGKLIKLGVASAAAGATLIGFVSPALAADADPSTGSIQDQIAAASTALESAKTTLKHKQEAAAQAAEYQKEGTAGYFKYVGATGAYSVLTDPTVNGKLATSIKLGAAQDATSMDNMVATLQYINKSNDLRKQEGKPELQVSDTLMAMAQADVDWATSNVAHPLVFNIAENLAWGNVDPFAGWYTEEKADKDNGGTAHGHYDNIVNGSYTITGFAMSQYPNNEYGDTYGQTFDFGADASTASTASFKRSSKRSHRTFNAAYMMPRTRTYAADATSTGLYAGSRTMSATDYFANVQAYQAFLASPQAEVDTAQKAVDTAQKTYDDLNAQASGTAPISAPAGNTSPAPAAGSSTPGNSPAAPAPTTPDPATVNGGAAAGASPSAKAPTSTADPALAHLAKTGSNVAGVIALALGLGLTAVGAFTLRRKASL